MPALLPHGDQIFFGVGDLNERLKGLAYTTQLGMMDPWSTEWVTNIVRPLPHGNIAGVDAQEVKRVFAALKQGVRYTFHPGMDRMQTLRWTLESGVADCLPADSSLLKRDGTYSTIAEISLGDSIAGDGCWTTVTNKWAKGPQPLLGLKLSNGAMLRCTAGHKLFRIPRTTACGHPTRATRGAPSGRREWAEEIRADQIQVGDDLLSPERIPIPNPEDQTDPELAWLLGVHIADGWLDPTKRTINISGRDASARKSLTGKRDKVPQKLRVKALAERYGIATHWDPKSIGFRHTEWFEWLSTCGFGATQKHVPGFNMGESQIRALIDGLSADASMQPRSMTFSTVSRSLVMNLRTAFRMLGHGSGVYECVNHGGFGKNPIFRVSPWGFCGGPVKKRLPRVRAIVALPPEETFDIETDTHRFYLPEHDVIVHNCDNGAVALATALSLLNFGGADPANPALAWAVMGAHPDVADHIWTQVWLPRDSVPNGPVGRWVDLDLTTGPDGTPYSATPGYSVPYPQRAWWQRRPLVLT